MYFMWLLDDLMSHHFARQKWLVSINRNHFGHNEPVEEQMTTEGAVQ